MRVFVGEFTEQDLKDRLDMAAIKEAKEKDYNKRNGLKYIESNYDKKNKVIKVFLTDKF